MDMSLNKLQEKVKGREGRHAAVHGVAKSWTWFSDWTTTNVIVYVHHSGLAFKLERKTAENKQFKTYERLIYRKAKLTGNKQNICSITLLLRRMKVKTLQFYSKPIRLAAIKSYTNIKCVGNAEWDLKLKSILAIFGIGDDACHISQSHHFSVHVLVKSWDMQKNGH